MAEICTFSDLTRSRPTINSTPSPKYNNSACILRGDQFNARHVGTLITSENAHYLFHISKQDILLGKC